MAVVVSAMGGKPKVTDLLLNSVSLAAEGNLEGSEVMVTVIIHSYVGDWHSPGKCGTYMERFVAKHRLHS